MIINGMKVYGFVNILIKVSMICLPLIVLHILSTIIESQRSNKIYNATCLYTKVNEYWIESEIMRTSLTNSLLFGNKYKFGEFSAPEAFQRSLKRYKEEIIPGLEELMKRDLGNFTNRYRTFMTNFSVCSLQTKKYSPLLYKGCGVGALEFLSNNMLYVMKEHGFTMAQGFQYIKEGKTSNEDLKELMEIPRFKVMYNLGLSSNLATTLYYAINRELLFYMESILYRDQLQDLTCGFECGFFDIMRYNKDSTVYVVVNIVMSILAVLLFNLLVLQRLKHTLLTHSSCSLLLSDHLIIDNPLITRHIKIHD